jgi:NAD(P)-dependent dehydrogenase (short-subunit alcohol dehydrogenase family)
VLGDEGELVERRAFGWPATSVRAASTRSMPVSFARKAAVIAMTKWIGKDLAGTGILANCVAPAVVETPLLAALSQDHIDYMVERIPLGRLGTPDEMASLICFLASESLSFSTGACFDASGGRAVY